MLGKILIFLTVMILVMGKTVFISASLLNLPYIHPFVHVIHILITYLYNRYLWGKTNGHRIESVLAASVVAAFISVPKNNSETRGSTIRKVLTMYSGIPSVLFLELISYILYGIVNSIIHLFVTLDEIDEAGLGDNAKKLMDYYILIFRQLDMKFVVCWIGGVLLLYLTFAILYYYKGHPKKDIINESINCGSTNCFKEESEHKDELLSVVVDTKLGITENVSFEDVQEVQL
jgi:hypothetical protein